MKQDLPMTHTPTGQRVLVVDDEPSVLAACQQLLDRLNYEVVACSHPAQALELLKAQPSAVDVLLTDQAMPHMTGDRKSTRLNSSH